MCTCEIKEKGGPKLLLPGRLSSTLVCFYHHGFFHVPARRVHLIDELILRKAYNYISNVSKETMALDQTTTAQDKPGMAGPEEQAVTVRW